MKNEDESPYKKLCVFVQAEIYYLKSAFSGEKIPPILSTVIDFSRSHYEVQRVFARLAVELGRTERQGEQAFEFADGVQQAAFKRFAELGRQALVEVEAHP